MKKKLVYQCPSLYDLADNASGFCTTGTSASGGVFTGYTNCVVGDVADGSVALGNCATGYSNTDAGTDGCVDGPSVTTNGTACDTGLGV